MPTRAFLFTRASLLAVLGTLGCTSAPPVEPPDADAPDRFAHGSSRWEYLAARYVSKPLRLLDCDYPCDSGSAVIFRFNGASSCQRSSFSA